MVKLSKELVVQEIDDFPIKGLTTDQKIDVVAYSVLKRFKPAFIVLAQGTYKKSGEEE